ncbi:MAG: HAD family hydrolase [Pirellulales bacterium]|nr:HAD family hydrolase [Pirellulales bacterium]
MRYLAVVTDYDGVIAQEGRPSGAAIAAIQRLRSSGRRAVLITGRRLDDLLSVFPQLDLFDCVVAENGAVIYEPATRKETSLAKPPSPRFIERLKELRVEPLEVGRVIVATWLPHHTAVVQVIQEMGLELQVIFNRAAVMVLPACVNKSTGMDYALRKLGLSRHEVVGIGDSENDHSFLQRSECSATVANAVPSILQAASLVTQASNGDGFAELVDELLANDLCRMQAHLPQHLMTIGRREDGSDVTISPYGVNILIAGPSGSGKSTVSAGIVERLMEQEYQLCIVDPEGDYGTLPDVITIGNQNHPVSVGEVLALLEDPKVTLNVNLLGIPLADRPEFFGQLFPNLQAIRTRTGRPHWIVLDEAHHMLPGEWAHLGRALPQSLGETVLVTVHPDHLAPLVLRLVDVVIAVGPSPQKTIRKFADAIGQPLDWPEGLSSQRGNAVVWFPHKNEPPFPIQIVPGSAERIRHHRKYAEGNMRHRSFFFRGPGGRQNIRAQNLAMFAQIAEGVDEETWLYHLRRGDYSRWFRGAVKDSYLAEQAEQIERRQDLHPVESRRLIRSLIEARYTLPE